MSSSSLRPYGRLAAGALVLGLVAVVPAAPAAAGEPVRWTACGERLECAQVQVPLDWSRPHGRTITLAVARHLATDPDHRIGSLFVNPGGPGDSGVAEVFGRGAELDRLTGGRFDVVGWDPRGSGASTAVSCFATAAERAAFWGDLTVPSTRAEEPAYLARTVALAERCGRRNGDLLRHISSADQARDLDHLRGLVGDRTLTYFGESNGTLLGQTYAGLFPGRVRAMALDGIVDPLSYRKGIAAALADGLTDADEVWDRFVAGCEAAGPQRCAMAGHGPVEPRVDGLLARARLAPLPAPNASPPGELTYGELVTLAKFAIPAFPARWPEVSGPIEAAIEGDASILEDLAATLTSDGFRLAFEQNVALSCADAPSRQTAAQWPGVVRKLERVSRIGGTPFGWVTGAPCASWPVRDTGRYTGPYGRARTPMLLISMRYEPNTPLSAARRVERRLGSKAVLLVEDGPGHLTANNPSACVDAALGTYLVSLRTPPRGTVCAPDHRPFDPRF